MDTKLSQSETSGRDKLTRSLTKFFVAKLLIQQHGDVMGGRDLSATIEAFFAAFAVELIKKAWKRLASTTKWPSRRPGGIARRWLVVASISLVFSFGALALVNHINSSRELAFEHAELGVYRDLGEAGVKLEQLKPKSPDYGNQVREILTSTLASVVDHMLEVRPDLRPRYVTLSVWLPSGHYVVRLANSRGGAEVTVFRANLKNFIGGVMSADISICCWQRDAPAGMDCAWKASGEPMAQTLGGGVIVLDPCDGVSARLLHYERRPADDPLRTELLAVASPGGKCGVLLDAHGGGVHDARLVKIMRAVERFVHSLPREALENDQVRAAVSRFAMAEKGDSVQGDENRPSRDGLVNDTDQLLAVVRPTSGRERSARIASQA